MSNAERWRGENRAEERRTHLSRHRQFEDPLYLAVMMMMKRVEILEHSFSCRLFFVAE